MSRSIKDLGGSEASGGVDGYGPFAIITSSAALRSMCGPETALAPWRLTSFPLPRPSGGGRRSRREAAQRMKRSGDRLPQAIRRLSPRLPKDLYRGGGMKIAGACARLFDAKYSASARARARTHAREKTSTRPHPAFPAGSPQVTAMEPTRIRTRTSAGSRPGTGPGTGAMRERCAPDPSRARTLRTGQSAASGFAYQTGVEPGQLRP